MPIFIKEAYSPSSKHKLNKQKSPKLVCIYFTLLYFVSPPLIHNICLLVMVKRTIYVKLKYKKGVMSDVEIIIYKSSKLFNHLHWATCMEKR